MQDNEKTKIYSQYERYDVQMFPEYVKNLQETNQKGHVKK